MGVGDRICVDVVVGVWGNIFGLLDESDDRGGGFGFEGMKLLFGRRGEWMD